MFVQSCVWVCERDHVCYLAQKVSIFPLSFAEINIRKIVSMRDRFSTLAVMI